MTDNTYESKSDMKRRQEITRGSADDEAVEASIVRVYDSLSGFAIGHEIDGEMMKRIVLAATHGWSAPGEIPPHMEIADIDHGYYTYRLKEEGE